MTQRLVTPWRPLPYEEEEDKEEEEEEEEENNNDDDDEPDTALMTQRPVAPSPVLNTILQSFYLKNKQINKLLYTTLSLLEICDATI